MKSFKGMFSSVLAFLMVLSVIPFSALAATGDTYKDGKYQATATAAPDEDKDFDAYDISVEVEIADGKISSVAYADGNTFGDEDNVTYANRAMNGKGSKIGVASKIVDSQSADVDAVSGATCTSNAIINAVKAALEKAAAVETEAETEAETEVPTEAPTEAETEAPTEAETEAPTEAETQEPTEAETQAPAAQSVYVLMNIPYAKFYASLNNSVDADIVSSATTTKTGNCKNVYSNSAALEGGMDLNGVVAPVKLDAATYDAVKDSVSESNADYYISEVLTEAPVVYVEGTYADGVYAFSAPIDVDGTSEVSSVEATIASESNYGDYQINLSDGSLAKDPAIVYGVYLTTNDGAQYALRQEENLWKPSGLSQFAWSTGVRTVESHGGLLHSAHYADMEGKSVTSITFITSEGVETYELANALYVAPHHSGSISAVATSETDVTVYGVPADLENPVVTIATPGKRGTTLLTAPIGTDGKVTLNAENPLVEGTTYNVKVSSDNFAVMSTTVAYADEVYVLMNVPYNVFYDELNNDVDVDIVSSATTNKVNNCKNVYSGGATIEGGTDLNGVVVPVKVSLDTYKTIASLVSDAGADYYISGIAKNPAVYFELSYTFNKYVFSNLVAETTEVDGVEAEILSSTVWGDYQVNLVNNELGKNPEIVYGAYFTTEDGSQYAMRQSENLWNPHNYYEFAWSTGVKTSEPHGGVLKSAHYKSIEGKTITGITYITSEGVEKYNLANGLYVAPHHEGEISAEATSENTLVLSGVPNDLENVTVTVGTSGRGAITLARNASIGENGEVVLDEGNTFEAGKVYNVSVSSSNFAVMTTTVVYNPEQEEETSAEAEESTEASSEETTEASSEETTEASTEANGKDDGSSPFTGDNANVWAVMTVALAALGVCGLTIKKKKFAEEK